MSAELRRRRVDCGLSQVDLAGLAQVSTSTIRNAETGRTANPRVADRIDDALTRYELAQTEPPIPPLSLLYTALDGGGHFIDHENWNPASLTPRERVVCRALLTFALTRLDEAIEDGAQ